LEVDSITIPESFENHTVIRPSTAISTIRMRSRRVGKDLLMDHSTSGLPPEAPIPETHPGRPCSIQSIPDAEGVLKIEVRQAPGKDRGVFARRAIRAEELIERAPVLVISPEHSVLLDQTILGHYCYKWGKEEGDTALALGYGSLYNHSYQPNARFVRRYEERTIDYFAIRDIDEGEEISINYNGEVWFTVIG
jgi:uncharacterized protein